MTRPGSTHVSGCDCNSCSPAGGVIQVIVPGTGGGVQGIQGVQGRTGTQGATGTQGPIGAGAQGTQGLQGTAGLDGAQGIAGSGVTSTDDVPEGIDNLYYTPERVSYQHTQEVASDTWNITHNLGFYPNITVQDSAGTTVEGEIVYQSANAVQLNFAATFSGTAYLS